MIIDGEKVAMRGHQIGEMQCFQLIVQLQLAHHPLHEVGA